MPFKVTCNHINTVFRDSLDDVIEIETPRFCVTVVYNRIALSVPHIHWTGRFKCAMLFRTIYICST